MKKFLTTLILALAFVAEGSYSVKACDHSPPGISQQVTGTCYQPAGICYQSPLISYAVPEVLCGIVSIAEDSRHGTVIILSEKTIPVSGISIQSKNIELPPGWRLCGNLSKPPILRNDIMDGLRYPMQC